MSYSFEGPVRWYTDAPILQVAADRSVESLNRRIAIAKPEWVVIVRSVAGSEDVYYYVFRGSEIGRLFHAGRRAWSVAEALDADKIGSSIAFRGERAISGALGYAEAVPGQSAGPAAGRFLKFNTRGEVVAIGEPVVMPLSAPVVLRSTGTGGATRGVDPESKPAHRSTRDVAAPTTRSAPSRSVRSAPAPAAEIDVMLSAETNAELNEGASARVAFQVELAAEAMPLAVSQSARAKAGVRIVVSLSVENDAVEIVRSREFTVDPPGPGEPRTGFFSVRGGRPGVSRLAVAFRQGGTELGVIGLAVEVVPAGASAEKAKGHATAASHDLADDDKLALLVEQRTESGQVFYEYTLHSEALGLPYRRLRSKPLLDRGGGPAATPLAFVERIYERVTKELKSLDDLKELQREARALGAALSRELFDPDVIKVLWPLRARIKLIQMVSWEPYIPWELVRLHDPESDEIDERFLCEYGLVRTLSDEMPPRALPMERWAYLGAHFPMGSFPPVGAELDYFTTASPEGLRSHGFQPKQIAATRDTFYETLAAGNFDVLHISCHAESPHQSIERANLILGDETPPGDTKPRLIEVETTTVAAEARLRPGRPLVFVNACETGRVGAMLTAWGGWPNVFLRKGAGAFVGASWAIRDKPAAAFSTAFYNALLGGQTLAEAASAARAAAKQLGDASWLAFKVYGHPRARRAGA